MLIMKENPYILGDFLFAEKTDALDFELDHIEKYLHENEYSLYLKVYNSIYGRFIDVARVILFEMSSQDPERSASFYSSVFGWQVGEPNWGYHPVTTGSDDKPGINGGIALGPHDYPHGTRIQIEVDDIDDAISKSTEAGAQVVRGKMEFDDYYLAYLVDPVGIGFGLVQNKK